MHALPLLSDGFFLSLSLCLDIGIANVAIISLTLSHGFKPGMMLGLGTCFGDLVYAALALAGMAALLQFDTVRWVVWIGGSIVLLFLTFKMAREALFPASAPPVAGEPDLIATPRPSHLRSFIRGTLLAVSSPSAILWFAAVGGALLLRRARLDALYLLARQPRPQTRRDGVAARLPRFIGGAVRVLRVQRDRERLSRPDPEGRTDVVTLGR